MKIIAALAAGLIFTTAAFAQSSSPNPGGLRIDLDQPAAPKKEAPKKDEKKKDDGKKKDAEMAKIEGMEIAHGKGFMGLQIVDGTFKLSFYDELKKPTPPDVTRAALRWDVKYQSTPERIVLNPAGGNALASSKVVKPPYNFKLFITLITGEGATAATETLSVDFKQ